MSRKQREKVEQNKRISAFFTMRLDRARLSLMRYCIFVQVARELFAEEVSLYWMLVLLCAGEEDETSASAAYARYERRKFDLLQGKSNGANSGTCSSELASAVSSENDEYSQRTYIKYGNGVETHYEYDSEMRWLESIATKNGRGVQLQNMQYSFDDVGNIKQYTNDCLTSTNAQGVSGRYKTSQTYTYDGLYQLTSVTGDAVNDDYASGSLGSATYDGSYTQTFVFDAIGNMTRKVSVESVTSGRRIGDGLTYSFDYVYDENFAHRLKRAGNEQNGYRHFSYDANGNVIEEKDTVSANPNEETSGLLPATMSVTSNASGEKVYKSDYAWGYFKDAPTGSSYGGSYKRTYEWDSRNLLIASSDNTNQVYYTYDANGERTNKYTFNKSETLYFNTFWNWHKDSAIPLGQYSKNIYLGTTRIVTKLHKSPNEWPSSQATTANCYYYHSDHLGSAQLITDYKGNEYQRLEYTPYGELWIEKTSSAVNTKYLPYKFTGKERDEETGLYYFGARYLDPKYSRWMSTDPALNDYVGGTSSGEGGVYNYVNLNLYHYGGNNPIKYVDPDGEYIITKDKETGNYGLGSFRNGVGNLHYLTKALSNFVPFTSNALLLEKPLSKIDPTASSEILYNSDATSVINVSNELDIMTSSSTAVKSKIFPWAKCLIYSIGIDNVRKGYKNDSIIDDFMSSQTKMRYHLEIILPKELCFMTKINQQCKKRESLNRNGDRGLETPQMEF